MEDNTNNIINELMTPAVCAVCGMKLESSQPLKDANGNHFCAEHYGQYAILKNESKIEPGKSLLLG